MRSESSSLRVHPRCLVPAFDGAQYAFEVSLWCERRVRPEALRMSRKRWSVEDKRRIVERTLAPGARVARIAQAEGVNANQVFLWRRAYRNGELQAGDSAALVPVVIEAECSDGAELTSELEVAQAGPERLVGAPASGSIHIELPGCAAITVERGADRALLRAVIESL